MLMHVQVFRISDPVEAVMAIKLVPFALRLDAKQYYIVIASTS